MSFEGNPPLNQFSSRASLCKGQPKTPPATGSVKDFQEAVQHILKEIEISKHDSREHFKVFNASVQYFQMARPLLQPGLCIHVVPSLRQVVQCLEEVGNQDHSWRAELMMHLVECLVDSRKMEEAASYAKVTEEFIKLHVPHLYRRLFLIQVQHKLADSDVLFNISRQCNTLSAIYKIQEFKNTLGKKNEDPSADLLQPIFHLIVDRTKAHSSSPAPVQPADRVAFLLELALLALQVRHQKVAANCLKELKSAVEATAAQRIVMECVNCEINLLKRDVKMNDYSKAGIEARLKEIGKLDQWLQDAVREGDPEAMQAVCATQWNLCLPLLQHNLRKRIRTPLYHIAQVLEDIQSMFLEMRCQVHSELAVIEEEDGCLEASLTHLQKAMQLDNGSLRERLSSASSLLQLKRNLNQAPCRTEEKAAMLLLQTREVKPQEKSDIRPTLVAVGLLLAPDGFQRMLDADDVSKIPEGFSGYGLVAQLSSKAQHHSACVVDGLLARHRDDTDSMERLRLWATLAKTARKQEVWDVCRAACRFCLPFDSKRSKSSKTNKCKCLVNGSCAECPKGCRGRRTQGRDSLRLLAEIHFISAEATIQKLLTEGVHFNSPPVLEKITDASASEVDPNWVVYRDWIQGLSAYATSSFLRAAELGAEIGELWLQENAAVYLWNYSSKLLAAGKYQFLLPAFQGLVEVLQKTEYTGHPTPLVLLCDTVARGLIQRLIGQDQENPPQPADKGKSRGDRGTQKSNNVQGDLQSQAMQNVHKAQEHLAKSSYIALQDKPLCFAVGEDEDYGSLCEYALQLSNCSLPGRAVPIAARKQVVATWVQTKRLSEEQIDLNLIISDKCANEDVAAMTCVLVGVEMLQCNREPKHMEFSVPSLSTLVSMASGCSWSDAAVEMQVWCQLAESCHLAKECSLVLVCTEKALSLEEPAAKDPKNMPCSFYGPTAVNEMLNIASCLRGLTLVHKSSGELHSYGEAMKMFQASVSFAEKAQNPDLCFAAVKRYWNACLPLTRSPEERWRLQHPLKKMLSVLAYSSTNHANQQSKAKGSLTSAARVPGTPIQDATNGELCSLRAAIYNLLLQIHTDKADWKGALKLLDQAVKDMSGTTYQPAMVKQRILLKARLGENISLNMQKLQNEGEQCCSFMWHQMALSVSDRNQQLACYQKSITSLASADTWWMKVNLLLEFGEWLYSHNYPRAEAQQQVQWAVDVLLHVESEQGDGAEDESKRDVSSSESCESTVGVQGSLFTQHLSNLKAVRRLDSLVRAHTLLAVMADKTSPEHQLNLLRAYTFVLRIWQVSMEVCHEISIEMVKTPSSPPPSPTKSQKGKGKPKKAKDPGPAEDKPVVEVLDREPPSSPTAWAHYACHELARHIFKNNTNPHCINKSSITKQTRSLFYLDLLQKELCSLTLGHLSLPVMHLAEAIASALLERKQLSELYRLRIVRTCSKLGSEMHSPYEKELVNLSKINEQDQIECHKAIVLSQTRSSFPEDLSQDVSVDKGAVSLAQSMDVNIWLEKADIFVSMGLYQPARQFLAEAHRVSVGLGDQKAMTRSLLGLATLACEEQHYGQALIFLDKVQALGGDEEFWYKFTLTKVAVVVAKRDSDAYAEVDQVIKQGCGALKLLQERGVNRRPAITFFITSLEMRGAAEYLRSAGEHEEKLNSTAVQRLKAACDTFRDCATSFTELNCREQAAEALKEQAQCLRILANHASCTEDKQRFLLDGLRLIQHAVTEQEHVVLNTQSLLPSQEERNGLSLGSMQQLLHLRLALVEFCLVLLEDHCAEKMRQVLARERMTSVQITLMEFTCCTPEPDTIQEEWTIVGRTLGEVALGQLTAVSLQPLDNMEMKACFLSLMGKYFKLLAVQKDPIYICALWDQQAWPDPRPVSAEEQDPETEKDTGSSRKEPRVTSVKSSELQQKQRNQAQQLLAQARKALDEAVRLCLKHKLPTSILADASFNLLECYGQSDHGLAGQHLALYQSCCTAPMLAEVLTSACADTRASQLSALLSLHRKLQLSAEERPSGMLKRVEDSLNRLSKAFSHLSIHPNHFGLLAKLPSNMKILLLQHSKDGSVLYGALYEMSTSSNHKEKNTEDTGTLACSRVAKVSVCPQALLALREQIRAFGQETRHALLKKARWQGAEGSQGAQEEHQDSPTKRNTEEPIEPHFRNIVQNMENYLNPLLKKFDISFSRPQDASPPVPDSTKSKDKEEKGTSAKSPADLGEYAVLLADRKLLELPLEALSILQEESPLSVSRDFSLQLLCSRLKTDVQKPEKVESDNKKETKGGKGTKTKANQSPAIKVMLASHADNFKYFVDPHHEGSFEGTCTSTRLTMEILKKYSQRTDSKQTFSLSEMEQMLCTCGGFVYLGTERFTAKIPPAKLAALNLSECHTAVLFDLVQSDASAPRRSNFDKHKSRRPLEKTLETAVLLSLGGVGCVVLNQWHSSLQQNAHKMDKVLDNLLRSRQTAGQAVHALRKNDCSDKHPKVTLLDDQEPPASSKESNVGRKKTVKPSAFNCVLYGAPNLTAA